MNNARMRKRWQFATSEQERTLESLCDAQASLAREANISPILARMFLLRGIHQPEQVRQFFNPKISDLHDPLTIPGLKDAAQRIEQAVQNDQLIVIYGDYDVDGVCASAILWHVLTKAGARVKTYIPHRLDEGYGLNSAAIEQLAKDDAGRPTLIVTVDCGITAVEPAHCAKALGAELIITDHHNFDAEALPTDACLVHPGLPDAEQVCSSEQIRASNRQLCGAGVAFKLAWQVMRVHYGSDRLPEACRELLVDLLSYVALATVADVVPLIYENRILTIFGLSRIKQSPFVGLQALVDAARLRDAKVNAYDIGFKLGPRLNACGRLGHAADALRLLTEADSQDAIEIASMLTRENERRRSVERSIFTEAKQMVLDAGYDKDDCRAIVLGKENWHAGVVGIVASRLVEAFQRPTVMLCMENGQATGSARSIDGFSIHDAFTACQEHLERFGGHAMAAGLGLATECIESFRQSLVAYANERLQPEDLARTVSIDAPITLAECTLPLFEQIMRFEPFGRGNESPRLLLENVSVDQPPRLVGKQGNHLSLLLRQGQHRHNAIGFRLGDWADDLSPGTEVDIVFEPGISQWQGRQRTEIRIVDLRKSRKESLC